MTKVAIVPETTDAGSIAYRAIAGSKHMIGKTPGEALDALSAELPQDETGTLVIVQHSRSDVFFTAQQQQRLQHLMVRWRAARESGANLSDAEQSELDSLIEAEVEAASRRTAELVRKLAK